ncbi:MAG TPA: hypothetical protein VL098_06905 [Flavipsychrobacter sp.]|nr:hypothetical protein [Flavipsychrobacter sp.]
MERVTALLKKLEDISSGRELSALDIDLMMDYVRVIYADLLEARGKMAVVPPPPHVIPADTEEPATAAVPAEEEEAVHPPAPLAAIIEPFKITDEPTLEEMTQVLAQEVPEEEGIDVNPEPAPEEDTDTAPSDNMLPEAAPVIEEKVPAPPPQPIRLETGSIQNYPFPKKTKDDIRKFVGINEKFLFINELFAGNKDAYEEVLNELAEFSDVDDAVEWLKVAVAKNYDWTEDDFNVQDFYRMLDSYYRRIKTS